MATVCTGGWKKLARRINVGVLLTSPRQTQTCPDTFSSDDTRFAYYRFSTNQRPVFLLSPAYRQFSTNQRTVFFPQWPTSSRQARADSWRHTPIIDFQPISEHTHQTVPDRSFNWRHVNLMSVTLSHGLDSIKGGAFGKYFSSISYSFTVRRFYCSE